MFILKHLKTLQRVSIVIQIIFRELESSIPLHTGRTQTHQVLCCRITTLTFYIFNKF